MKVKGRNEGLNAIWKRNRWKKEPRPFGDRSVELRFGFCFQQKCYGGWGSGSRTQAEGHKRDRVIGTSGDLVIGKTNRTADER
jgi:hypothetical protein